jgi:amidase
MDDYHCIDALEVARRVKAREVSAAEVLEAALARIEALNPKLNAIVHLAADEARRTAAAPLPDGPFEGAPFLIKDLYCPVARWPMTNGSAFVGRSVSALDDPYVARCRAAGFVLLGKTNTPEFGIPGTTEGAFLGPCRNPWNLAYSSGGSSGGAASATAAGFVAMAHATDGQGSIRIPAAQCGLFGLKPTRGRNPSGPEGGTVFGYAIGHVVSRSVRDSAAMLDWTGAPDPHAPESPPPKERPYLEEVGAEPGRLRIAFHGVPPSGAALHPDVARVLAETAHRLEGLGHDVFEAPIAVDWRAYYAAQNVLTAADQAGIARRLVAAKGREPVEGELERNTAEIWAIARALGVEPVMAAAREVRRFCREIIAHWDRWDVFLCPVAITPPPPLGLIDTVGSSMRDVGKRQAQIFGFTPPFNFTGQPSASVPMGMSADGLPIGMMFTARYGDEATLFRLAGQLEAAAPWRTRAPTLAA